MCHLRVFAVLATLSLVALADSSLKHEQVIITYLQYLLHYCKRKDFIFCNNKTHHNQIGNSYSSLFEATKEKNRSKVTFQIILQCMRSAQQFNQLYLLRNSSQKCLLIPAHDGNAINQNKNTFAEAHN